MQGDSTQPGDRGGPPPAMPTFGVEELIGGRYRIQRFLGQGAAGEVYAARDLQLGADVALKVLRPGGPSEGISTEWFKREILLARRVSHPNVCRIFDLGVHLLKTAAGTERPVLFLSMELLDGRTLVRRIEEEGPYDEAAAAAIVGQLAVGLGAAHRAGVVHRDLKSSNILLVAGAEGERAVITDFGLAREQEVPSGAAGLTGTGGVLGTPAYMAPEQVEGKRAGARADLYAFGVVLFEMLTGRLPFEGETPLSMAVKRLNSDPLPIESLRSDLSPRMRAVVRRCLERDPADRFGDALEIPAALEGQASTLSPRLRRRRLVVALVAGFAVVGGWAIWRTTAGPAPVADPELEPLTSRLARRSVAVLGLRNATGRAESAWLSAALAEMLSTELAASDALRAVPGETVALASSDLGLEPAESLSAPALARLRRAVDADWLLLGSYTALGEPGRAKLRLDLRLQRADGESDLPLSIEGSEAELFDLVGEAGRVLRRTLGAREPVESGAEPARSALPETTEAVRLYSQGLEKLRASEPVAARELLESALVADPEAPLAWSALARAWSDLGYAGRALDAARTAWEKSARLPRAESLLVEGRFRLASGDWDPAIANFRALWRFYPDDLEQGLNLAGALLEAERAKDVPAVVNELRALAEPARSDPRVDLAEARAADGLSDFRGQLAAARRAEERARAVGSRRLAARAWYEQGVAHRKLGDPAASRSALLEARRIFASAGDRGGVALALQSLANLERGQGKLDEAAALFAEARATFAALGNRQREARAELSQGLVVSQQGDLAAALDLYRSALTKLREVGDRRGAAAAGANVGTMLYELGDLAGGISHHEQALSEFRALGDESRAIVSLQNIAQMRIDRAELGAARTALEQTLAAARRIGDRAGEGYAVKALGDVAAESGDQDAARREYEAALKIFTEAGEEPWRRVTELALAVLARDRGEAAAAELELARLVDEFGRAGMANDRDEAALQRARTLIALGRATEATPIAGEVTARAAAGDSRRVSHLARVTAAELALARRDPAAARRELVADLESAQRAGITLQILETRALLARAAAAAGDPAARRQASELAAEVTRAGCGRILMLLEAPLPGAPRIDEPAPTL